MLYSYSEDFAAFLLSYARDNKFMNLKKFSKYLDDIHLPISTYNIRLTRKTIQSPLENVLERTERKEEKDNVVRNLFIT